MKFIVCFVVLVSCAEALLKGKDGRPAEEKKNIEKERIIHFNEEPHHRRMAPEGVCDGPVQEVSFGEEEVLEIAIKKEIDYRSFRLRYPNNACQKWKITAAPSQCIVFTVGDGGFNVEKGYDFLMFKDTGSASVIKKDGYYPVGYDLFTSETNNVDVIFTSDNSEVRSGSRLDVRSTSCDSVDSTVKKVMVAAEQVLEGAIVTDTESDGEYPNYALQLWEIITDENQCIVITVGEGDFWTESFFDLVVFKDSGSDSEICRDGRYRSGDVLFTSETNNVDIRFSSDFRGVRPGFTLDVQSIPCSDRANYPQLDKEWSTAMNPVDAANGDCGDREVVVADGRYLKDALIINRTDKDFNYWEDPCRDWRIISRGNWCLLITVGRGFDPEERYDFAVCEDSNSGSRGKLEGFYQTGDEIFRSDTSFVDVEILGGSSGSVFTLDARSIPCTYPCDDVMAMELVIAAGEMLEGALVTDTEDGKYPNKACQNWNIMADENQCIIITVGNGGFSTEPGYDFATFKDSNSESETRRDGDYSTGDVLFTSETNSVDVRFTSDDSYTSSGFTLDVESIACAA